MTAVTGIRRWSSLVRVLDAHRVLSDSSRLVRKVQPMNGVFTSSYSKGTKRVLFIDVVGDPREHTSLLQGLDLHSGG